MPIRSPLLIFLSSLLLAPPSVAQSPLFCVAPRCGNHCFGDPQGDFLPEVVPNDLGDGVDNMLACQEIVDTKTNFSDVASRCVDISSESNANLTTAKLLLYENDEDCKYVESLDRELKSFGCCSNSETAGPMMTLPPTTTAPATPSPVAPTNMPTVPTFPTTPTFAPVGGTPMPTTAEPSSAMTTKLSALLFGTLLLVGALNK